MNKKNVKRTWKEHLNTFDWNYRNQRVTMKADKNSPLMTDIWQLEDSTKSLICWKKYLPPQNFIAVKMSVKFGGKMALR